jgi:hypothetical protein
MQRDILLLTEMIDAAEQAHQPTAGITIGQLDTDRQRRDALFGNSFSNSISVLHASMRENERRARHAGDQQPGRRDCKTPGSGDLISVPPRTSDDE